MRRFRDAGLIVAATVATTAVFTSLTLAGAIPAGSAYNGNPSGPTVGIIGDSITRMSSANIGTDLYSSYYVAIDAVIGITIGDQLPVVQTIARTEAPADWIINLGTNDALLANEGHPTDWQTNLTALVKAVGYACVILTTVNINADRSHGTSSVAVDINNDLEFLARVDPQHFHLLDWNALVQSPARVDWLWIDHVHPSDLGRQKLADLYRQALTGCS
jgi:hypothetical protein